MWQYCSCMFYMSNWPWYIEGNIPCAMTRVLFCSSWVFYSFEMLLVQILGEYFETISLCTDLITLHDLHRLLINVIVDIWLVISSVCCLRWVRDCWFQGGWLQRSLIYLSLNQRHDSWLPDCWIGTLAKGTLVTGSDNNGQWPSKFLSNKFLREVVVWTTTVILLMYAHYCCNCCWCLCLCIIITVNEFALNILS